MLPLIRPDLVCAVNISMCVCIPGWFKPVITPDAPHLVILKGGQLELRCHDDAEASMGMVQWLREKGRKIDGELKEDGASVIFLTSTQIQHMGRYTCENTQTKENSSIYVYVKGLNMRVYTVFFFDSEGCICSFGLNSHTSLLKEY